MSNKNNKENSFTKSYNETRMDFSDSDYEECETEINYSEIEHPEDKKLKITKQADKKDFSFGVLNKLKNNYFKKNVSLTKKIEDGRALRKAVRDNDFNLTKKLINNGYQISDNQEPSLACIASRKKNLELLKLLIESGVDINIPDKRSQKSKARLPLQEAARKSWYEGVWLLLSLMNSNIDFCDKKDITALHFAAKNGSHQIVELLLGKNASPDGSIHSKFTPLYETDSLEVAKLLLSYQAKVNYVCSTYKYSPLHFQVYKGNLSIVKLLIQNKANINAFDYKGRTPLFFLSKKGELLKIYQLFKKHPEINTEAKDIKNNNFIHSLAKHTSDYHFFIETHKDFPHLWMEKNIYRQTPKDILIDRGFNIKF